MRPPALSFSLLNHFRPYQTFSYFPKTALPPETILFSAPLPHFLYGLYLPDGLSLGACLGLFYSSVVHIPENPLCLNQFMIAAGLYDLSPVHHNNSVGILQGCEPVGNR